MTTQDLINFLQRITALALALGTILLLFAVFYFRRSRRDAFWRQRRNAGQRGFRLAVGAVFLLAISGALCMITLAVSFVEGDEQSVEVPPPTFTQVFTSHITPTFALPAVTDSPPEEVVSTSPTIDPILEITLDPTITLIPEGSPNTLTLTPDSNIKIWAVDDQISPEWQPISPRVTFTSGANRLYFYIHYSDISAGDLWKSTLLREGEIIREKMYRWGSAPAEGETFFFFGEENGFLPGRYEIRIAAGEGQIASTQFTITAP